MTMNVMEWEETSPSPGGSASGSSLSQSEAEEESVVNSRRYYNGSSITSNRSTKVLNNNSDKKPNLNYYAPPFGPEKIYKETPILISEGINGLNLNPSPPVPVGQDLSIGNSAGYSSPNNYHHPSAKTSNSSSPLLPSKGGQVLGSGKSCAESGSSATSTTGTASKKTKPIPPPLDLSIGASSLAPSSSQSSSSSGSGSFQYPGHFYSPYYHLSSPKFNQAEKTLPLRKRWHSWSPNFMHCPEEFMLPLGLGVGPGIGKTAIDHPEGPTGYGPSNGPCPQNSSSFTLSFSSLSSSYGGSGGRGQQQAGPSNGHGPATPQSAGLQTPTPFYTPNEPSPKFMNSPVFSYSTPDTTLYQGPYSPIRNTSLYAPTSPYLSSSLNTPTFHPSAPTTSAGGSAVHTISAISSGGSPIFNTMVPSTMLSPASSQASSNSLNYEDLHEKSGSSLSLNNNPVWNIFMAGTKVRFSTGGISSVWHMVDYLSQSGTDSSLGIKEYAPGGLQVKTYVVTSSAKERVQLTLCPVSDLHHPSIEVDCEPGHPFMVDKKGWCAVKPEAFMETYGSHCQVLEGGDIIYTTSGRHTKSPPNPSHNGHQVYTTTGASLNSSSRLSTMTNGHDMKPTYLSDIKLFPEVKSSYAEDIKPCFGDIKPSYVGDVKPYAGEPKASYGEMKPSYGHIKEDIKPFPVPISLIPHNHHYTISHDHSSSGELLPRDRCSPGMTKKLVLAPVPKAKTKPKKSKVSSSSAASSASGEPKGRRPMNAFLLFAKDKRPELIQQYPGKDNRSISVLLGEAWKNLEPPEKELYSKCAKDRADEQKKTFPDCWKRKRSPSNTS